MWRRAVLPCAAAALAGGAGYLLGSRRSRVDEAEEGQSLSEVRESVARRASRLPVGAILDYADTHGTEMARAVSRLRKNPDAAEALAEAHRQHEVIGALLWELRTRQDTEL